MAEYMKPVGVIELVHIDASCYGKNGAEIPEANMFVDLVVGTELYTAYQLEQAIEPYKKAADSFAEYVICQKERYINGDIYCSCCGEKLDGYHTHKDWCVVAEAEKYAALFAKERHNDN